MSTIVDDLGARIGADRVLAPRGALPQPAERLDASGPVRPHELEIAVTRLCLDSTSHRNLAERSDGDPQVMGARVRAIVRARGKMHNPETRSGGVLVGTVTAAGDAYPDPPLGAEIVSLASLSLTPLRLDRIVRIDAASAQLDVEAVAYLPETAPYGLVPGDLPLDVAIAVYDVYAAASHTRDLTPAGGTVCVLGAGHAGKVAMAAARDAGAARVIAVDLDVAALARVQGLCDRTVAADLRDPLAALGAVGETADLTVHVATAEGCEPAAILLTRGTILLYSMATSFQTAALTADGMSSEVRMIVGNGFAPDRGAYALDLVRTVPALRAALEAA